MQGLPWIGWAWHRPRIPNFGGQSYRYLVTALKSEYRQGQRIHAAVRIMAEDLSEAGLRAVAAYYANLTAAAARELAQRSFHPMTTERVGPGLRTVSRREWQQRDPRHAQPERPTARLFRRRDPGVCHRSARNSPDAFADSRLERPGFRQSGALFRVAELPCKFTRRLVAIPRRARRSTHIAGCHGSQGVSANSSIPSLASQDPSISWTP